MKSFQIQLPKHWDRFNVLLEWDLMLKEKISMFVIVVIRKFRYHCFTASLSSATSPKSDSPRETKTSWSNGGEPAFSPNKKLILNF